MPLVFLGFFLALGTSFEIPNALCSLVSCLLFLSSLGVALAIASRRCVPAFLDGVKVSRTPLVLTSYTLCWVAREVGPWSCFVNVCVCLARWFTNMPGMAIYHIILLLAVSASLTPKALEGSDSERVYD